MLITVNGWSQDKSEVDFFTAAGVQYEIQIENYKTSETFFDSVESEISLLCETENKPDLIIFPEYIGVFYQLIDFNSIIESHEYFQEALVYVLRENPKFGNLADVFIKSTATNDYLEGWSRLAAKWNVNIVAGSCFVATHGDELRNRSFVFNSEGDLIYHQDKVFLTEFETEIIGLTSGGIDDAGFFKIGEQNIALTICRDTYSTEWENKNSGAFLWIDIKANGEAYTAEQQRSFMRALPLRLVRSDVEFGMTVCAVGRYLDLFWEGESTALYKQGSQLALADISDGFNSRDQILFRIRTAQ